MTLDTFKRQDWLLNLAVLFLAVASLAIIYSAAPDLFWYQALWFGLGFGIIFLLSSIDLRPLVSHRWLVIGFYVFALLLLSATLLFGVEIRGTKAWLPVGFGRFQTSEFAKVALIVLLAYFFGRRHTHIGQPRTILKSFLYFFLPASLIALQPDGGSVIVLSGLWVGFLLVSGIRWRHLFIGFVILCLIGAFGWDFLREYQRERIIGFLDPAYDTAGTNYNVIQSKVAIGSAGLLGKGFGQGTQVQLKFLPEPATDFILAAFIEEWGLVGGIFVVGAFLFLLFRIMRIGMRAENNFSRFVCIGTIILFLIQFGLNAGSTLGLLPVVGVTFPFFSYGGSSLLTGAVLVGIIQSIAVRSAR